MNRITDFHSISAGNNKVFVNPERSFLKDNSFIEFTGENNILFIEDGANFSRTNILFPGSNAVVYISQAKRQYVLDLTAHNNTAVYIGKNNIIWNKLSIIASEGHNVIIGGDSLISWGGFIRTADPHLIYDSKSHGRINPSKSVFLGDHIWIGQRVTILKGTHIGSGSIIGADSVVANKLIPSNTSAAGNPAKIIRGGVFFSKENVNAFTKETAAKYAVMDSDDYIYNETEDTIDIPAFDEMLQSAENAQERFDIVMKYLAGDKAENRFYISPPEETENLPGRLAGVEEKLSAMDKKLEEQNAVNESLIQKLKEAAEDNAKLNAQIKSEAENSSRMAEQTKKLEEQNELLIKKLESAQTQLEDIRYRYEETTNSFTYRLGMALTAIPRKLRSNKNK